MLPWKAHEHIDFDFADCQLDKEINSENEEYTKRLCRQRINMAGKYIMLIGKDTKYKYKYVRWGAQVAIEKGCTIIGVNLDNEQQCVESTSPDVINNIGAVFVPFNPKIIAYALGHYQQKKDDNYYFKPQVYQQLGLLDPWTAYLMG